MKLGAPSYKKCYKVYPISLSWKGLYKKKIKRWSLSYTYGTSLSLFLSLWMAEEGKLFFIVSQTALWQVTRGHELMLSHTWRFIHNKQIKRTKLKAESKDAIQSYWEVKEDKDILLTHQVYLHCTEVRSKFEWGATYMNIHAFQVKERLYPPLTH